MPWLTVHHSAVLKCGNVDFILNFTVSKRVLLLGEKSKHSFGKSGALGRVFSAATLLHSKPSFEIKMWKSPIMLKQKLRNTFDGRSKWGLKISVYHLVLFRTFLFLGYSLLQFLIKPTFINHSMIHPPYCRLAVIPPLNFTVLCQCWTSYNNKLHNSILQSKFYPHPNLGWYYDLETTARKISKGK